MGRVSGVYNVGGVSHMYNVGSEGGVSGVCSVGAVGCAGSVIGLSFKNNADGVGGARVNAMLAVRVVWTTCTMVSVCVLWVVLVVCITWAV